MVAGVSYDAGLFNENKLYFSNEVDEDDKGYPGTNAFVTEKNATNLSCGPDGVYGTYDDGLPSTYKEFYKLMERMVSGEGGEVITPFAYTGEYNHYTNMLMSTLEANFVGANGMRTTVDFNSHGEAVKIVDGFNTDGTPKTKDVVLTEDNAYLIKSSLGLYYASEFCAKVFSTKNYCDSNAAKETSSNINTQEVFLRSGLDGSTPIAMIIEGTYWYNESISEGAMGRASKLGTKDLRFMPMPHQYEGTVTPREDPMSQVMIFSSANAFIPADSTQKELAKLFLQFCYSDEELQLAEISNNGIGRDLEYNASSIQDRLSFYAKSLNEMKSQAVSCNTYFSNMTKNPIAKKNYTYWNREQTGSYWKAIINNSTYDRVCGAFKNGKATARSYFEGLALTETEYNQKR